MKIVLKTVNCSYFSNDIQIEIFIIYKRHIFTQFTKLDNFWVSKKTLNVPLIYYHTFDKFTIIIIIELFKLH